MRAETGQATFEWVGLVLTAALALGALGLFWSDSEGREAAGGRGLGDAVASRITCAARGSCTARAAGQVPVPPPRSVGPSLAQRTKAFRSLRGLGLIAKRTWILCLGHKRWRHEVEHPRVPTEPFPVDEALRIANGCLNPLAFLGD